MAGIPSHWPKDKAAPPAPNTQPATAEQAKAPNPCTECEKSQCKNGERTSIQDYACWCGGDTAPAKNPKNIENDIPADSGKWDQWAQDNNLPKPYNGVDKCCMIHDLDLGRLRQKHPTLFADSNDYRIGAINAKLAKCFGEQKGVKANGWKARFFAQNGEVYFNHISAGQTGGAGMSGAMATSGADAGFGSVGASSASSGAMASGM